VLTFGDVKIAKKLLAGCAYVSPAVLVRARTPFNPISRANFSAIRAGGHSALPSPSTLWPLVRGPGLPHLRRASSPQISAEAGGTFQGMSQRTAFITQTFTSAIQPPGFCHQDKPWAHVVLGGVDTESSRLMPMLREGSILFVGRLLPHKGIRI